MRKIDFFYPFNRVLLISLFSLLSYYPLSSQCDPGTIRGTVYLDNNFNGTKDSGEKTKSGVFVRARNSTGIIIGQSLTDSKGEYLIPGLNNGQNYRLEFVLPDHYKISATGPDNGTEIQFVTAPNCNVSLGVIQGDTNCSESTEILLSCFVNSLQGSNPGQETLIGLNNRFNAASPVTVYATQAETGSVWGMAYSHKNDAIFSAAFVKQNAALAIGGHDAIYKTQLSPSVQTSLFLKVSELGINTGSLTTQNATNCNYGKQVGKIGLGGLTIDDENKFLYVVNLFNNRIVKIDVDNPNLTTTKSWQVPNPGCSFNDYRVFALDYHEGFIYTGVTCTAETSASEGDTYMHIYRMNVNTGNFSLVFSSDYTKGVWTNVNDNKNSISQWLTDIDFTQDGRMIIGLSDRKGHNFCKGTASRVDVQTGDILILEKVGNQWVMENNGQVGSYTGTGVSNGQGPGGGEFFGDDYFPKDESLHNEIALGSIHVMPNSSEVIAAVYDPIFNSYAGGLHRYNYDTGQKTGSKELYASNVQAYFGKATGFGDIVSRCGRIQVEIGNYVWSDKNCDGIQNAGENGMASVALELYDINCELVGTTTTDSKGRYSFNKNNVDLDGDGVTEAPTAGETYFVSLAQNNYDANSQSFVFGDVYYFPTELVINSAIDSDLQINNSACVTSILNGIPVVEITPETGNSSSFDLGLKESSEFDLALTKQLHSSLNVRKGDIVEFEIKVINQGAKLASSFEIVDYITPAYSFDSANNPGWVLNNGIAMKLVNTQLRPNQTHSEILKLEYVGTTVLSDLTNYAEIASAKDYNNQDIADSDSTPDMIKDNDKGGIVDSETDDLISDDGTIDEDDHDPATLKILDLALKNEIRDAKLYDIGDEVVFDMTVYNQGNVSVESFQITNMFPSCLEFQASENAGWVTSMPGIVKLDVNNLLLPGETRTLSLRLGVIADCDYDDILDIAEISAFVSSVPGITQDVDSDADDFLLNDKGGNPYDFTDNLIDDDGTIDEDDHDPAVLSVRKIDLALIKTTETEVFDLGDDVTFEIRIFNQGDVSVASVMIVDYLPDHTSLVDDTWQADPNDPSGKTVYKTIDFATGFGPGEEYSEFITLNISATAPTGVYIINEAEIAEVRDHFGTDISHMDVDSNADSMNGNDMGGEFATVSDNNISDNGTMDEDDHDPAGFFIADIEISAKCECLENATSPYNGLFGEEITITSLSGQTWYIDEVNNIFDGASVPDGLVPFTTGPAGYTLTEFVMPDNISEYIFNGRFVDGQRYTIRFTNGDGAYLQASGGGPTCSYNRPVINSNTGLSAVCTGSAHNYTVSGLMGCTSYQWSLSGGGSIVGSSTSPTVRVQWGNFVGGPHTLQLTPMCSDSCLAPVTEEIRVGDGGGVMSCVSHVNVSLNMDCTSQVDADLFLTSPVPFGTEYQLMLLDHKGNLIANNFLTEEYLWETLTAKVVDPCSGNSCWATVTVEDKMAPAIQCGNIELPCWLMNTYEPIVLDNCSDASFTLINEKVRPIQCDDDYIKEVTRTYVSRDGYGNESEPCEQVIRLERLDFGEIVPPNEFLLEFGTNLTCVDSIYNKNGEPDPKITGAPTLNGFPIFPIQDLYCNVAVEYEDFVVADFGCVRKIMRTWRIYEDWCTVGRIWTYVQTIEIADTESPEIECPDDLTVTSGGGPNCEQNILLDLPEIVDDCSSEFVIDISYVGGFIQDVDEPQNLTIPSGSYDVTYNVYDACENLSSCDVNITVLDETPPVAVCDENTVVSLRSNGTAKAFAETFDDGTYDDCSLFNTLVKRIDSPCDCKRPVFADMHYLGELNGRFYYLSRFLTHGSKAFLYSSAYGGMLLTLESEEEADWVFDRTREFITSAYYVGLSDFDHPGRFTWSNHADPIFDHWAPGQPEDVGNHVITNSSGDWMVVDGNDVEAYYVMELSDPCGYSDEVHFCCEDAGAEHMVLFRAIDYFGKVNECMVMVEVQDKVAPKINCPSDRELDCEDEINMLDLSEFGMATATDQCDVEIREELIDERSDCGLGDLIRRFYAEDRNGFSTCDQILSFSQSNKFDNNTIVWPDDFTTDLGCSSGDLHPDSLATEFGRPQFPPNNCSMVAVSFDDQTFDFSGTNGSDACLKILRRWSIIDWCQIDDPGYEPATYEQVIKVNNVVGPEILGGCDSLVINTFNCDSVDVVFAVQARDDCTAPNDIRARLFIDIDSDGTGTYDLEEELFSNIISFDGMMPLGNHFALVSFSDQCGNTTTCSKVIEINNIKGPTAACIDGISVALEPMDLDGDGQFDTEMACIRPEMLDASSTHTCGFDIDLSFSAELSDTILCFDCDDIGMNTVELWVTDEFGNTDLCTTTVEVQDNNMQDFCPRFDLALTKKRDTLLSPGPTFVPTDIVCYSIEVINQGNMSAYNVEVVDYIPDGMSLVSNNWTDQGDGTALLNNPIAFLEDSTSTIVSICLQIDEGFMGFTLANIAEIKAADDDQDPNNVSEEDADSEYDCIKDNDHIGGDNEVGNDNNDEDDHDPDTINVMQTFDLELAKDCGVITPGPFSPGSMVSYDLTVTNTGTLNAVNVQLADYVPAGLELDDSNWTVNAGVATLNDPIDLVEAGSSVTVSINFVIADDFMGDLITNVAEIIDPDSEFPLDDTDSEPGNFLTDGDEDDSDEKTIEVVQEFDLALTKIVDTDQTNDPINLGDDVYFIVTVYNQGSLDASNISVMDYIPEGLSFDPIKNSDFSSAGSNAQASIPFLAIDQSISLEIVLTVDDMLPAPILVNNAEIVSATNVFGLEDEDSPLGNTNDGSSSEIPTDNDIDDERPSAPGVADNPADEDDYDPAQITVSCPPSADCQAILEASLDEDGNFVLQADDINNGSSDDCNQDLNFTVSQTDFDCGDLQGSIMVTLTVTVDSGLEDTCTAEVTIVDENDPIALCQNITVELDENGEVSILPGDIDAGSTDACNELSYELDITDFDCTDLDMLNPVVLTVTDGSGNSSTCPANVTVVDNEDPSVNCFNSLLVDLDGNGMGSLTIEEYILSDSDNCSIVNRDATQFDFDCDDIDVSPITVVVTVEDQSGNTAECTTLVEVADTTAPECDLGSDIEIIAETPITLADLGYTVDDNCSADADITTTIVPNIFDCDDVGMMILVTVTVTDEEDNASTCSTTVEVIDNTQPVCVPQDVTLSLDGNGEAVVTAAQVDGGSTAGCDENPLLEVTPNMFDCMDVGDNIVTLTITANNGNSDTCSPTVTIVDDEIPSITCEPDFTLSLVTDMVMISTMDIIASSSDNCGISSSMIDISVFDCDDDGMTFTVTATVEDPEGNTNTCTTDVTIDDDTPPTCTLIADITIAPNVELEIEDLVTDINTFFDDNCADAAASIVIDPDEFDCTMLGANVVTVTVTDDSGNSATCTSNVTVEDIPAPVCIPMNITVTLDAQGNYFLLAEEVDGGSFGGCAEPLDLSVNPDFLGCNDVDLSPVDVVLTVTDQNSNSTTCVAEVTVIDDIPPVITCAPALTLDLDASGSAVLTVGQVVLTAEDGCGIDSQVLDMSVFDCSDKNMVTVVTATVTDDNGNTTTCTSNITVEDNLAPSCVISSGLTFPPDIIITPADVLESFTDNCASVSSSSTLTPNIFDCDMLGDQMIELLVTDDCGNTSTCTGTIEIVDNSVPVCVPMDITVSLDANGEYMLSADEVDGGSTASCGSSITLEVDPNFFDCGDLGDNIVTLTVTATGGATSTCNATVTVEDNTPPVVVCPADMSFPCETDISNPNDFGQPTFSDNCDQTPILLADAVYDVNSCNVGTLERTFTVTDDDGNVASCVQVITVTGPANPLVESDITWPDSPFDAGDCIADPLNIDSGEPEVDTTGLDCFNITVSFSDNVTGIQCSGTIIRTWTVVDSCQAPGGVFTFQQTINVNDVVGPTIMGPSDITVILPPGNTSCDTFLNLAATVTDCAPGFTESNDSPHSDNNNTADASGTYPVGETTVTITATDVCGNTSTYAYVVEVVDTTAVFLDCAKVIDNIEMDMMVVVHISQTQFEVDFGDCNGSNYTVSFSNVIPNQDTVIATCSDVGLDMYTIYLWTGGMIIDSCTNLFQIVDGGGFCNTPLLSGTISGRIATEDQRELEGANIQLMGSPFEPLSTGQEGSYAFPAMEFGGKYQVIPEKDTDYLNGVSTLDLIAIQKHILGSERIKSPYKLIAADIDRSGNITGSDLLELRKLILGTYTVLPNNTSWRIIDKSHKFIDPLNPFAFEIPEYYEIDEFSQSMLVDFVGVKIGDVNDSAIANLDEQMIDNRSNRKFYYQVEEKLHLAGEVIEVKFSSSEFENLLGLQHGLKYNASLVELVEIRSEVSSFNSSNYTITEDGMLKFSWNGQMDEDDVVLFSMVFKSKSNVFTSELLEIHEGLRAEAYMKDQSAYGIDIEFVDAIEDVQKVILYQNVPNPWTENSDIKFYMPEKGEYTINLYDINGRLIHSYNGLAKAGTNVQSLSNDQFEFGGVLYYELIAGQERLINKMLLLK